MQSLLKDGEKRMDGAIKSLEKSFTKLRTGRASTALVENVVVDYYNTPTPLNQIASISVPDPRSITIQPWDKAAFSAAEKAILKSDLGLTPINDGKIIRINIPPLTEERRKDLVKVAKKDTEEAKVAVRNVRRDMNEALKKMLKDKAITEDDERKGVDDVQKLTDKYIKYCDDTLAKKEKEILEI
ncbi:MAG TPA: ribosome recycling factor [Desulfovibrio sp.]|jgi:ribosome recycling factor|uniref:ribosome recycling factor n=1 Tax=Desulfovibrio TaxID=872 RepID=UPI00040C32D0|nr:MULTISPECIES: ribosome recycling factor [Desulfovibrio]MDY0305053.1 ribosome recycling factor [Desulfovibrionaceae bacterium]HMM37786.1 ribosome recycling factor [Desulfovibrio sp.]